MDYLMLWFIVVVVWLLFVKLSLIQDARYPAWVWRVIQWFTLLLPVCTFEACVIALPLNATTIIILGILTVLVTGSGIMALLSDR